jgi:rubrerythrin
MHPLTDESGVACMADFKRGRTDDKANQRWMQALHETVARDFHGSKTKPQCMRQWRCRRCGHMCSYEQIDLLPLALSPKVTARSARQ